MESKPRIVKPNPPMASSILRLVELRLQMLAELDPQRFATFIVEGYYEVCKELITALLTIEGRKAHDHRELIVHLEQHHSSTITRQECVSLDRLRKQRNSIAYRGAFIDAGYLILNEAWIRELIAKLQQLVIVQF